MAARGLRVLAFARRGWEAVPPQLADGADPAEADAVESGLTLLGLVGLIDPPRPEARHAVDECREAGIVPVMITGDHPATARAVATELGILEAGAEVLTGADLRALPAEALAARVEKVRVYARVDPEQKIDIVKALQARGQFVAMTGDGVNDAPALRRADVGVAMGLGGTDVAREASALILLDDDFATIVAAVEEGRRIFDNIRKFVRFVLGGNLGEILTVFLAPLIGLPMALLPIQILWVNLLTDGLPGLALTVEGAEPGVMQRPPLKPGAGIFDLGDGAARGRRRDAHRRPDAGDVLGGRAPGARPSPGRWRSRCSPSPRWGTSRGCGRRGRRRSPWGCSPTGSCWWRWG